MSTLPGRWALTMRTPIGSIGAEMTFIDRDGTLTGTASGRGETVELHDIRVEVRDGAEHASWNQAITKPLRLDLAFEVVVDGDDLRGHSRAGRLPRSSVTGRRLGD